MRGAEAFGRPEAIMVLVTRVVYTLADSGRSPGLLPENDIVHSKGRCCIKRQNENSYVFSTWFHLCLEEKVSDVQRGWRIG